MTRKGQRSNRAIDPVHNMKQVKVGLLPNQIEHCDQQPEGRSGFIRDLIDRHMKRNRSTKP